MKKRIETLNNRERLFVPTNLKVGRVSPLRAVWLQYKSAARRGLTRPTIVRGMAKLLRLVDDDTAALHFNFGVRIKRRGCESSFSAFLCKNLRVLCGKTIDSFISPTTKAEELK